MIKVAARNKFSRKSSLSSQNYQHNVYINQPTQKLITHHNLQQKPKHNILSTKSFNHFENMFQNLNNQKSTVNLQTNLEANTSKKTKSKKYFSMNSSIHQSEKTSTKKLLNQDFTSSNDKKFDTIKIDPNYTQKSLKSHKKSKTQSQNLLVLRSSNDKKLNSILKKSDLKRQKNQKQKVTILNQQSLNQVKESQHYQSFLKQIRCVSQIQLENKNGTSKLLSTKLNKFSSSKTYKKFQQKQNTAKFLEKNLNSKKKSPRISVEVIQFPSQISPFITDDNIQQRQQNTSQITEKTQGNLNEQEVTKDQDQLKAKKSIQIQNLNENEQITDQEALRKKKEQRQLFELKYKQETQQLFRKFSRQIAVIKEKQMFQKQSKNFYEDLRLKMMRKYDLMMKDYRLDDKEKQKIAMLIEGCNLQKHRRVCNFEIQKKQKGHHRRPQTSGAIRQASKDIYRLSYVQKKKTFFKSRPQSSSPKSSKESFDCKLFDRSTFQFLNNQSKSVSRFKGKQLSEADILNGKTKNLLEINFQSTNSQLQSASVTRKFIDTSNDFNCLLFASKNSTPRLIKKKSSKKMDGQKRVFADKFSLLMDICDEETDEQLETKKKMRIFQYYCSKVDNNFEKISEKMKNYISQL